MDHHVLICFTLVSILATSSGNLIDPDPYIKSNWTSGKLTINYANQSLSKIPINFNNHKIQRADFSNNHFYRLNDNEISEANLRVLQELNFQNCSIEHVSDHAFLNLLQLTKLDLSRNKIIALSSKVFQSNIKLNIINLNYNNINVLEDKIFNGLLNLQEIHIGHNKIQEISQETFLNLSNLREIDISFNNIKLITFDFKESRSKLRILKVQENPWYCDCRLQNFSQSIIENQLDTNQIKCCSPSIMKGRVWEKDIVFACEDDPNTSKQILPIQKTTEDNQNETNIIKSSSMLWVLLSFFVALAVAVITVFVYYSRKKLAPKMEVIYVSPEVSISLMEINPVKKPPRIQPLGVDSNDSDFKWKMDESLGDSFRRPFRKEGFSSSLNYSSFTLYSPGWGATEQFSELPSRYRPRYDNRSLRNYQSHSTLPYSSSRYYPKVNNNANVTLERELGSSTNNTMTDYNEEYVPCLDCEFVSDVSTSSTYV